MSRQTVRRYNGGRKRRNRGKRTLRKTRTRSRRAKRVKRATKSKRRRRHRGGAGKPVTPQQPTRTNKIRQDAAALADARALWITNQGGPQSLAMPTALSVESSNILYPCSGFDQQACNANRPDCEWREGQKPPCVWKNSASILREHRQLTNAPPRQPPGGPGPGDLPQQALFAAAPN